MVTKVNVITPSNLGKTIVRGALDANKWDVKYDVEHFEFVEGKGLHLKDSVLEPLKNADVASGALVGSNLELSKVDGSKVTVPLAGLIPAAKADHFLKAVEFKAAEKKLVFTVGNDLDAETNKFEVEVADLIPVTVGAGLEGDGTAANPVKIKVAEGGVLKSDATGLSVDTSKLVELVDGTGDVSLGYILPKQA